MKTLNELMAEKANLMAKIKQSEDPATDENVNDINAYLDHVLDFLREITPTK